MVSRLKLKILNQIILRISLALSKHLETNYLAARHIYLIEKTLSLKSINHER